MTAQLIIGVGGVTSLAIGMMVGRSWLGSVLVGTGVGAGLYAVLLTVTDDPLAFVVEFLGRVVG